MNLILVIIGSILILIGSIVTGVGWNWDKFHTQNKKADSEFSKIDLEKKHEDEANKSTQEVVPQSKPKERSEITLDSNKVTMRGSNVTLIKSGDDSDYKIKDNKISMEQRGQGEMKLVDSGDRSTFDVENNTVKMSQNNTKIIKVKIGRIIEDANNWLRGKVEKDKEETKAIIANFNKMGVLNSGTHVAKHIKRANSFIKSCNDYVRKIDREIEDLLMPIGEQNFEDTSWLKEEYKAYLEFIQYSKNVKDVLKKENNELCIRFCDEPTFNKILQANPYLE